MLEVRRKDGESFEGMIRRFTKKTIQSGKILQAKKIRFFSKKKTDKELKDGALRRQKINTRLEYLKRVGKLDDFIQKRGKNKRRR